MTSAVDKAYREIRRGIVSGTYPLGAHLKAADLAARMDMSRTPVREALRRLHAEGLIDFIANHGAFVSSWTRDDIEELFALRSVLESHAAELAATRITPNQLSEARQLVEQMAELARTKPPEYIDRIAELNGRFHTLIVIAAASRRLAALLASLVELLLVVRTFHSYTDQELLRSMAHHRELVDALAAGDGRWAASVMRGHILFGRHAYVVSNADVIDKKTPVLQGQA